LGGGRVLDPHPRKHGPGRHLLQTLECLARGEEREPDSPEPQAEPPPAPSPAPLTPSALELETRLRAAGIEPPSDEALDAEDLQALRAAGRAVRVSRTLHYHPDTLSEVRRRVIELADANDGAITLAQLRDALGTSRKFAQALLEHLDAEKVTIRRGDAHHLRGRQSAPPAAGGAVGSDASPPECSRAR
jgi:selenocysteine-specific elongation factor